VPAQFQSRCVARFTVPDHEVGRVPHQADQSLIGLPSAAMPQQVPHPLNGGLDRIEQVGVSERTGSQAKQDLSNRPHPHGHVESVKDAMDRATRGRSHQVRQGRIAVADHGQWPAFRPSLLDQGGPECRERIYGAPRREGKAPCCTAEELHLAYLESTHRRIPSACGMSHSTVERRIL
jgi:hypothetical protein